MDKNIKEGIDSLMNENLWRDVGVGALKLVLIFLISGIIIRIGKAAVRNIFKVRTHSALRVSERRKQH